MNPYFPMLFSPLKVKKTTFRNRIFAGPTGLKELTDNRHLVIKNMDYLRRKAQGGAAVVCLGDVQVDETGDISWNPKVRAWDKENEPGFYDMAGVIQAHGAHASMELVFHGTGPCRYAFS